MMKMRVWVALLLATMSGTSAKADLIGDTYTVNMIVAAADGSGTAFPLGYTGTFDGMEEVIGDNPWGRVNGDGDLLDVLVLAETVTLGSTVAGVAPLDIGVSVFSRDKETGAATGLFGAGAAAILGSPAVTVGVDVGISLAPDFSVTAGNGLDATVAGFVEYEFVLAAGFLIDATSASDPIGLAGAFPNTFDTLSPEIQARVIYNSSTDLSVEATGLGESASEGIDFAAPVGMTLLFAYDATAVPEPSSFAALGLLGMGGLVYRRRKKVSHTGQQA